MRDSAIRTETICHEGRSFVVNLYPDDSHGAPWDECDGHGPVRELDPGEPLQRGEVLLYDDPRGRDRWVYGFGAALVQAQREGWGLNPEDLQRLHDRIGRKPTKGQIRAEAVRKDMRYLWGYLAQDWCYTGVCVQLIGPDGEPQGDAFDNALWGVESCGDYWEEVARDLADEILADRAAAWRDALSEARKVRYWASRDVQTVGTRQC